MTITNASISCTVAWESDFGRCSKECDVHPLTVHACRHLLIKFIHHSWPLEEAIFTSCSKHVNIFIVMGNQ